MSAGTESEVTLTAKEFDLLLLFIRSPDRAFTRDEISSRIWGDDLYVDRRILPCTCEGSGKRSRTIPPSPGTSRPSGVWAIAGSRKDRIVEKVVLLQTPARHGQPPRA